MRHDPTGGNAKAFAFLAVLIAIGIAAYAGVTILRGDILPGFPGMQNGLFGEKPQGTGNTIALGDTFTQNPFGASYSWVGSPTPSSATIDANTPPVVTCLGFSCDNNLNLDAQTNPISTGSGAQVNYYVPVPGSTTRSQYVTGQVETYTYSLDVSMQSGGAGTWNFGGDTVWYNLLAVDWNLASTDPLNSSVHGSVYEVPLYAVVTQPPAWHDQGNNACDACLQGHAFSFYSAPNTAGQTLATLAGTQYQPGVTNVNSTLSSIYAPDTRFPPNGLVYYPITLLQFRANPAAGGDCTFGCTYPSVQLTIQLFSLRVGEYIVTNPSTTGTGGRGQGCTGLACIPAFFGTVASLITGLFTALTNAVGTAATDFVILMIAGTILVVALVFAVTLRRKP